MNEQAAERPRPWFDPSHARIALGVVAILTALRFALAPVIPLAFDEAYYWRWSTHFAFGYFDHPPLVAWLVALGTEIAGDTEFGIRLIPLVLSVPASWAVWRSAELLFGRRDVAWAALVFFNLTLIVSVGTILATPDASLLIASAFLLYCLAKVAVTGRPAWWIAAGIVTGFGLLAKFTALFWLPSILIWLLLTPRLRPWLATLWPWLGLLLAMLMFLPNLIWNATHDWATFGKQFGRVTSEGLRPEFLIEHLGAQIGMATPVIFVLGWLGLAAFFSRRGGPPNARILISALVWPSTIYFLYHALHARVEGNWTGPIFPAFVIAAAAAIYAVEWRGRTGRVVAVAGKWAAPVGLVLVLAIYIQTLFGILPLGSWDPTASRVGAGIAEISEEVEALRADEGATLIVTADYPMTSWLSFYSPNQPAPVYQYNERERWVQEPPPTEAELAGPLIAILPEGDPVEALEAEFGNAEQIATLTRRRDDLEVATYAVYRFGN